MWPISEYRCRRTGSKKAYQELDPIIRTISIAYFPLFLLSYLLVLARCSFQRWMTWPFLLLLSVFAALNKLKTSGFLITHRVFSMPHPSSSISQPRPHEHDEKK